MNPNYDKFKAQQDTPLEQGIVDAVEHGAEIGKAAIATAKKNRLAVLVVSAVALVFGAGYGMGWWASAPRSVFEAGEVRRRMLDAENLRHARELGGPGAVAK